MDSASTADSTYRLEGDEALPAAFLHIAQSLPEGEQREDCRVRLLALASDVGLIVESRDTRAGGAKCLGRLLPAIAELCRGWTPKTAVPTQELKVGDRFWYKGTEPRDRDEAFEYLCELGPTFERPSLT